MQAEVTVWLGDQELQRITLSEGDYLIGRGDESHILVDVEDVSRRHAKLCIRADSLAVEDLGSSSGTVVGGVKIDKRFEANIPQVIQVGSAIIQVSAAGTSITVRGNGATVAPSSLQSVPVSPIDALKQGGYRMGGEFGRGSMGAIHLSEDTRLGRTVAMKVIISEDKPTREIILRFIREAQVMAQLDHPNIVPIYELGVNANDEIYYAMKFVRGVTLHEVLKRISDGDASMIRRYSLGHLLTIFQKVCDAVAYAHSKGIIHRDLKPENIMIGEFGQVLVMDWGLAMIRADKNDEIDFGGPAPTVKAAELSATILGDIMGTPQFMAPEQAEGRNRELDDRADVFALGGILYSILTLQAPFVTESFNELLELKKRGFIPPPIFFNRPRPEDYYGENSVFTTIRRRARKKKKGKMSGKGIRKKLLPVNLPHCPGQQIPEALSQITMTALATDPDDRYQTVKELQKHLSHYQNGLITLLAQHKMAAIGVGMAVLLLFAVVLNIRRSGELAREKLVNLETLTPTLYESAQELFRDRQLIRAKELMEHAVSIEPNLPMHHLFLGKIYLEMEHYRAAMDSFETTLTLIPNHVEATELLRECEQRMNDPDVLE